jgi:hypothetical protein
MAEPDGAGLDPLAHRFMGLALRYSTLLVETMFGRPPREQFLADLEADPIFTINACHLRMLSALCDGDTRRADELKRKAERIRLRDNPPQMFAGSHIYREYAVYAFAGDLARLKQLLPQFEARAAAYPGWQPVLFHVRASYHKLRGAPQEALEVLDAALELVRAGEHPSYVATSASRVEVLGELGRGEEALSGGERSLAAARAAGLDPQMHVLMEAVALARAGAGDLDGARALADEAVAMLEDFGSGGLVMGGAYETRARVALLAGDDRGFEADAARCAAIYRKGKNALLTARYAALMNAATAARLKFSPTLADAAHTRIATSVHELLFSDYADSGERARAALRTVLREAGAGCGLLYLVHDDGPHLIAQEGAVEPPPDLDTRVEALLSQLRDSQAQQTQTCTLTGATVVEPDFAQWRNASGQRFTPLLLTHSTERGVEVTGVVALGPQSESTRVPPTLLSAISEAFYRAGDAATLIPA